MAITYNNGQDLTRLFTFDSVNSLVGISYYLSHSRITFDYFRDDAVVDDYVAFGHNNALWEELTLNVGTALSAGVTIAWEYLSAQDTWTALSGVTDNTNGFTTTGSNTVTFTQPTSWKKFRVRAGTWSGVGGYSSTGDGFIIRARISAIAGSVTEGGANQTTSPRCKDLTVQLDGGTNTLTDIYNADVAGGWGVMTKVGDTYILEAGLRVGDNVNPCYNGTNATTFEIGTTISEQFQLGKSDQYGLLTMDNNSTFTMGEYTGVYTKNQSNMIYYGCPNPAGSSQGYHWYCGTWNMYGSSFRSPTMYSYEHQLSCLINWIESQIYTQGTTYMSAYMADGSSIKDCVWYNSSAYLYLYTSAVNFDGFKFIQSGGVLSRSGGTLYNLVFKRTQKFWAYSNSVSLVDCLFDDFDGNTTGSAAANANCDIKYYLDLDLKDEDGNVITGANVKVVDAEDNIIADAEYTAKYLIRVYGIHELVKTDYSPTTITISKDGYETYKTSVSFTTSEPVTITLKKAMGSYLSTKGNLFLNTDAPNVGKTMRLIEI